MPEVSSSNIGIFSMRHITAFVQSGTLNSTLVRCLGAMLKMSKKKAQKKKIEKCGTKKMVKRTLIYNMRAETRRHRDVSLTSAGHIHFQEIQIFQHLAHVSKGP